MKSIPIKALESVPNPIKVAPGSVTRREFLQGSAVLTGVIASGSILAGLAPSRVWAAPLSNLSEAEGKFLLRLTQVIFPHKNMPDAINALAVKDLDAMCADAEVAKSFRSGMTALNEAAESDWMAASPEQQLKILKANTGLELFSKVRGKCITSLYDNELAYKHFGYEGDAFSKGGYITRGFDDLKWLPNPPAEASPAPYF